MRSFLLIILSAVAVLAVGALVVRWSKVSSEPVSSVRTASSETVDIRQIRATSTTVTAEVVRSRPDRMQGLSERVDLDEGRGMLFVFPVNGRHGIWMKDMRFSLDIIWIDDAKRVVHIEESVAPETYPRSFQPPQPARYVLEINAGWVRSNGLNIDDRLTW